MNELWHIAAKEEIEDKLNTDFERGMTSEYAQSRLKKRNAKTKDKSVSFLGNASAKFSSVMAIMLIIVAIVAMNTGKAVLGTAVVVLVFISEILGFAQDIVAYVKENKVKKLLLPKVIVIRDGQKTTVLAEDVTEGDIVVLAKGDVVPCDGRITYAENPEVDEACVTGAQGIVKKDENADLEEDTPVENQSNMLFAGSTIVAGKCNIVACATGKNTVIATKENQSEKIPEKSYMQDKIREVGKVLATLNFVLIAGLLCICILSGTDPMETAMLCLALGAVSVPSKIPSIISGAINKGILKIAKEGSFIKSDVVAENLAVCDVVITGKSGILTKDELSVCGVFTTQGQWNLNDANIGMAEKSILKIILEFGAICTEPENKAEEQAMDIAVLKAAQSYNVNIEGFNIVKRYPFNMQSKLMTAVAETDGEYRIITKGDVNEVIEHCTHAVSSSSLDELTDDLKNQLKEQYENVAGSGYKTIAVAYKDTKDILSADDAQKGLTFVGAIMIENQLREDTFEAVKQLRCAGIRPVMATYDNEAVAENIAKRSGIMQEDDLIITGKMLSDMTEQELDSQIEQASVFAALKPHHKAKILEAFKRCGKNICMLSDSAYDRDLLENCTVSVSRKNAYDITERNAKLVTDGAFSSLVNAMKQAQMLYLDVRKSLRFMISGAIAQMVFVMLAILLTNKAPLTAIQILAAGVLVSGILPFGLPAGGAWDKHRLKNVKEQKSIFVKTWLRIVALGVFIAVLALVLFIRTEYFDFNISDVQAHLSAQTAAFLFFVFSAVLSILYLRRNVFTLREGKKELICTLVAVVACIAITTVIVCVQSLKNLFGFYEVNAVQPLLFGLIPVAVCAVCDFVKLSVTKIKSLKMEAKNGANI